jgi:hypothetical protein
MVVARCGCAHSPHGGSVLGVACHLAVVVVRAGYGFDESGNLNLVGGSGIAPRVLEHFLEKAGTGFPKRFRSERDQIVVRFSPIGADRWNDCRK